MTRRGKNIIRCIYGAVLTISIFAGIANADIVDDTYIKLNGLGLFTSNNNYLQTGWYDMDGGRVGDDIDIDNANFVGSYYFGEKGDILRPFVQGGFGFSKIEQNNVNLGRGTRDDIELDSQYIKIGAGLNYNPTQEMGFVVGVSSLWMESDSDYKSAVTLAATPLDNKIRRVFEDDSSNTIYDIYAGAVYHPSIYGYDTHFDLTLHYLNMDFDHGYGNRDGISADLSAGVYTHELTRLADLPIRAHLYVSATLLDDELSDTVGFDNAFSAGISILWKVGPVIHIFDDAFKDTELSFNLQGTTGDNDFKGVKASVSFCIAKF